MNDIHDALGAYAVGALQADDALAFERHLASCPACRAELPGFEEAAAGLGLLAGAPPPPPALRTTLLAEISVVDQLGPRETRATVARVIPAGRGATPLRRAVDRRTRVLSLLVAAVSVVALALGGLVGSLAHRQPTVAASADASLLTAPDARIVPATLPDGTSVSFVVSRSQNRALFVARDLPSPGSGRTYQLWTMHGGTAVPDGTTDGGPEVSQWFHGAVSDAAGLAVTVEPAGGSLTPTPPVLASGSI